MKTATAIKETRNIEAIVMANCAYQRALIEASDLADKINDELAKEVDK